MKAASTNAGYQAKTFKPKKPKPRQQGDLDCLCGLYTIVNACKIAYHGLGLKGNLNRWQLMALLIDDLEGRKKLADAFCHGIGARNFSLCLEVAQKYFLGKHGLQLIITRPYAKRQPDSGKKMLKLVQGHLQEPGTSVVLEVETSRSKHWTVIRKIARDRVYFADSDGMKPAPAESFRFKGKESQIDDYTIAISKNWLMLLSIRPVE